MFQRTHVYKSEVLLEGKTVIVTGASSGIGFETAKDLFKRGATVLMLSRNEFFAMNAIELIKKDTEVKSPNTNKLRYIPVDLGDIKSVQKCARQILKEVDQINLLINNAAVFAHPVRYTKDGLETHMAVNYFGLYLLTLLLLPKMIQSTPARIVNVSSLFHQVPFYGGKINIDDLNMKKIKYDNLVAYTRSKLAVIFFTQELAQKLKDANITGVTTYSLHPGIITTKIIRNLKTINKLLWTYLIGKTISVTPEQGCYTTLYCALDPKEECNSGLYYNNCHEAVPHSITKNKEISKKLWEKTWEIVDLKDYNPFITDASYNTRL